jgi:putative endonuclease
MRASLNPHGNVSTADRQAEASSVRRRAVHHVYVLSCADGTYYTGYTTDVDRRVAEHDAGEGAKYTRGRTPVDLIHVEDYETRSAAMSREAEIKQLSRTEKESLVRSANPDR